jgi:hypothetical protein
MRRSIRFVPWTAAILLAACAPEGPSGFVTYNLAPDSDCVVSPDSADLFVPIGRYDISSGFNGASNNCDSPYVMNLLVNSFLRPNSDVNQGRAEPNILQLHSAEVRLMDINRATIAFDAREPQLPNPFLVTTNNSLFPTMGSSPSTAVASVEVIPKAYADQLGSFVDKQILAEIQIFGTTTGDVDVDLKPFVYTIQLCDGCLTINGCTIPTDTSLDEVYGEDTCRDNASADGRVCVDYVMCQ